MDGKPVALVVDDSRAVRTQMKMVLDLNGLAVDFAEDAEKALELVEARSYDIIFLDVVLPEMDGYTACKRITTRSRNRETPVIMLTGKNKAFDKIRGVMAGCKRYVCKPIEADVLRRILDEFVTSRAA